MKILKKEVNISPKVKPEHINSGQVTLAGFQPRWHAKSA
jgi:hypothetical protein